MAVKTNLILSLLLCSFLVSAAPLAEVNGSFNGGGSCISSTSCSGWTNCDGGSQTRSCTTTDNGGVCGVTNNFVETQSCSSGGSSHSEGSGSYGFGNCNS